VIKHWEDFDLITRCIATQVPTGIMGYNSASYIMQSPGWVLIALERLNSRAIPLDGRPHLGRTMGGWLGDSRGHWEGNTLVVETTSYTNRQSGGGVGATVPAGIHFENIRVVEHFVPVSANRIHYYATVEDPKTWVRPWTLMQPWEKDRILAYNDAVGSVKGKVTPYQMYEYACHEGNESLGLAMKGTINLRQREANRPPVSVTVAALVGGTEADVRAKFGEPEAIVGPRWEYQTAKEFVPLYVYFEGGKVVRAKVACNGGKMQLASAEANASGASSFRLQSAPISPVVYATAPMVQIPKLLATDPRTLVIERLDQPGERAEFAIGDDSTGFYDLAKAKAKPLARGGVYRATIGVNKVTFKIDAKAKIVGKTTGKIPVVSRLLRFTPG
jgi:hypothetical protein